MEIDNESYKKLMDGLYDGVYCVNLDKRLHIGIKARRGLQATRVLRL